MPNPDAAGADAVPAERFGRYELSEKLASGGMATVYRARALGPDGFARVCAVKRIHPHLAAESSFTDMFLDEARIAARIDHPNVCQVFDFGRHEGTPYLAMEYLAGEPLARVIAQASRRRDEPWIARYPALAATIAAEACEGLHAAHELRDGSGASLDVVHRDVSPQNLFVTFDGVVKVVDFGIASARDRLHRTETGNIKGKLAYMSPEQLLGAAADRRIDVWAMGVVLWEMLTFRRLFRRDTAPETMDAVRSAEIPSPSSLRPEVPASLDAIAMRALTRDPERRYPNARAMAEALVAARADLGETPDRIALARWMEVLFGEAAVTALDATEAPANSEVRSRTAQPTVPETPGARAADRTASPLRDAPPPAAPPVDGTPAAPGRSTRAIGWAVAGVVAVLASSAGFFAWPSLERALAGTESSPGGEAVDTSPVASGPAAANHEAPPADLPDEPAAGTIPGTAPEAPGTVAPADEPGGSEGADTERDPARRDPAPSGGRDRSSSRQRPRVAPAARVRRTDPAPSPDRGEDAPETTPSGRAVAVTVGASSHTCIDVPLGLAVRLDGGSLREGPLFCDRVEPGVHTVTFVRGGRVLGTQRIDVPAHQRVRLRWVSG